MKILSLYLPGYAKTLVYMLQSTEYQAKPYLKWYWRTSDFTAVSKRRQLVPTKVARLLRIYVTGGLLLQYAAGIACIALWYFKNTAGGWQYGLALIVSAPIIWAHALVLPLVLGRILIIKPRQSLQIRRSKAIFAAVKGMKIAVAGSYGKTTTKEILATVLSAGKKVAATPANRNVASSHAQFARRLNGDEDVVIIEYGEGKPGDVNRFARTTQPNVGVITGLAPAHLDQYKTLHRAGSDIISLANYLKPNKVFVNAESPLLKPFISKKLVQFSQKGVSGWKVSDVSVAIDGTRFVAAKAAKKGSPARTLKLHSGLLGRHQIGPLMVAVELASQLGMSDKQIIKGVGATMPFEHRMQPRVVSGAWVIDDTYNGNIEGIRAGLSLLKELNADRKYYVTPGLVDQGRETKAVHLEMGRLIADANPDVTVLMRNSVTEYIRKGLNEGKYEGVLQIETDPLGFYSNMDQFLAAGDLVLMQNDWTDNYV